MIAPLDTPRLHLRPIALSDADQIQERFPHFDILRYMSATIPWPYPADGAFTWIRDHALPSMARAGAWHWTIRRKHDPGQIIGAISLMLETDNNRGFWIGLPWQGQGYVTEASDAVTDYWFDVLKFPTLRVPKARVNAASRRVSEKQGMRIVATAERDYVSGRLPADLWEITAGEWHARRRG